VAVRQRLESGRLLLGEEDPNGIVVIARCGRARTGTDERGEHRGAMVADASPY
jgi:hypothetical protein